MFDTGKTAALITAMKRLGINYLGLAHCTGESAVKRINGMFGQAVEFRPGMVLHQ